jgi:hypothetical protein
MEEDEDQSYTEVSHKADVVFTVDKQQGYVVSMSIASS